MHHDLRQRHLYPPPHPRLPGFLSVIIKLVFHNIHQINADAGNADHTPKEHHRCCSFQYIQPGKTKSHKSDDKQDYHVFSPPFCVQQGPKAPVNGKPYVHWFMRKGYAKRFPVMDVAEKPVQSVSLPDIIGMPVAGFQQAFFRYRNIHDSAT